MKLLRAVLGRLDAWAALLLGVLVALGVVILLALPGPWHKVVKPGAASRSSPPSDVAVFASGAPGGTCNSIVWLHITDSPSAVTAVVIAPDTQGFVPGAGLTPLQQSFLKHDSFQCGFCAPGIVLSATELLGKNPHPSEAEAKEAIAGNLCRCTGYQPIIDAILAVSAPSRKTGGLK